jgi:hypothetical protein
MAFRASFWARNAISRPTIGKAETRNACRRWRADIGNQTVGIQCPGPRAAAVSYGGAVPVCSVTDRRTGRRIWSPNQVGE